MAFAIDWAINIKNQSILRSGYNNNQTFVCYVWVRVYVGRYVGEGSNGTMNMF